MITVMVVRGITTREFLETTVVEEEAMTEEEVCKMRKGSWCIFS